MRQGKADERGSKRSGGISAAHADSGETLVLISGNEGKAREFAEILGIPVTANAGVAAGVREIQHPSLVEVIRSKANDAFALAGIPVLVEHTALYLDSMGGMPGPMCGPFLEACGISTLGRLGNGGKAVAKTAVALRNHHDVFHFVGETRGRVVRKPEGRGGFGWDAVFVPDGARLTFAQMSCAEKNRHSMRRKALEKLKAFFSDGDSEALSRVLHLSEEESRCLYLTFLSRGSAKIRLNAETLSPERTNRRMEVAELSDLFGVPVDVLPHGLEVEEIQRVGKPVREPSPLVVRMPRLDRIPGEVLRKANRVMERLEGMHYCTYGDSLTKNFRQALVEQFRLQEEDSFYLKRSANCKLMDELLGLSTARGEALYYNTKGIPSAIEYVHQAVHRSRGDGGSNRFFHQYICPDLCTILVYDEQRLAQFANRKGGRLFVPFLSLAETAGFLISRLPGGTASIPQPYQEELAGSWALSAFEKFPEKHLLARRHLRLIGRIFEEEDRRDLHASMDSPQSFEAVLDVICQYRDFLIAQSRDPQVWIKKVRHLAPGSPPAFITEQVILAPGLRSRANEVPNSPPPSLAYLLGVFDRDLLERERDMVSRGLDLATRLTEGRTRVVSVLDWRGNPLVSPHRARGNGPDTMESLPFRLLTLLLLPEVSRQEKISACRAWNALFAG